MTVRPLVPAMLGAALVAATPAYAVDLESLVTSWTVTQAGQGGSDGVGEAHDVVITEIGEEIVAVGYIDGAADHGKDAFAINLEPDSSVNWDLTLDSGSVSTVVPRNASDERILSVAVEPLTGAMAWCGSSGQADGGLDNEVDTWWWLQRFDPILPGQTTPPTVAAEFFGRDANGTSSRTQACTGLDFRSDLITAAGWSENTPRGGRWYSRVYDEATDLLVPPLLTYDDQSFPAVPDKAFAAARRTIDNSVAIVGTRGFAGLEGSDENRTDWFVQYYTVDPDLDRLVLEWEHTIAGDFDDMALGVAFDPVPGRNNIVVVGYTNGGLDTADQSDRNWLIVNYPLVGDGYGSVIPNWSTFYGLDSGVDEIATSLVFDDDGNILVAGSGRDETSGNEVFRVAKISPYDGSEMQFFFGEDYGGDSRALGIDYRNERIALAGYVNDGTSHDFGVSLVEGDRDGDTYGDSIDMCPDDPVKNVDTGVCGCNSPDLDTDEDGLENCIDECPTDPLKTEVGTCGCWAPDVDTDEDGTLDCNDQCPEDPEKSLLGECGCHQADSDEDGDGVIICEDACLNTPANADVNEFGCSGDEVPNPGDTGDGPVVSDGGEGCGCSSSSPLTGGLLLPLVALLALRRRSAGSPRSMG